MDKVVIQNPVAKLFTTGLYTSQKVVVKDETCELFSGFVRDISLGTLEKFSGYTDFQLCTFKEPNDTINIYLS